MLYILVQSSLDMVSVNANLTTVTLANDKLQRPVHRSLNNHTLFPIFFFCTLPLVLHIQLLPQQVEHLHLIKVWASSFFIIPNIRIATSCNVWKCSSILNTLYKRPTGHISLIWTIVLASFFFESVYYEVTSEKNIVNIWYISIFCHTLTNTKKEENNIFGMLVFIIILHIK